MITSLIFILIPGISFSQNQGGFLIAGDPKTSSYVLSNGIPNYIGGIQPIAVSHPPITFLSQQTPKVIHYHSTPVTHHVVTSTPVTHHTIASTPGQLIVKTTGDQVFPIYTAPQVVPYTDYTQSPTLMPNTVQSGFNYPISVPQTSSAYGAVNGLESMGISNPLTSPTNQMGGDDFKDLKILELWKALHHKSLLDEQYGVSPLSSSQYSPMPSFDQPKMYGVSSAYPYLPTYSPMYSSPYSSIYSSMYPSSYLNPFSIPQYSARGRKNQRYKDEGKSKCQSKLTRSWKEKLDKERKKLNLEKRKFNEEKRKLKNVERKLKKIERKLLRQKKSTAKGKRRSRNSKEQKKEKYTLPEVINFRDDEV